MVSSEAQELRYHVPDFFQYDRSGYQVEKA
jgi:hypothetical protein